jgi:hypothetical protein
LTLFSDGIASRLLVLNLIRQLEEAGILDAVSTNKIYNRSIEQAKSFLENSGPMEAGSDLGWTIESIEEAITLLQSDLSQVEESRNQGN